MKKCKQMIVLFLVLPVMLVMMACSESYEEKLEGTWYFKDTDKLAFTLYSDGTGIDIDEDSITWNVVNDNILKLTYYDSSSLTFTIVEISSIEMELKSEDKKWILNKIID